MAASFSTDCLRVLNLLARSKNVLLTGAPGTGKSKLLAEVAAAFESAFGITPMGGTPMLNPIKGIPIPPSVGMVKKSPHLTSRNVRFLGRSFIRTLNIVISSRASLLLLIRQQALQILPL